MSNLPPLGPKPSVSPQDYIPNFCLRRTRESNPHRFYPEHLSRMPLQTNIRLFSIFVGYRLTYDVDIITHLRYYYQRFFCSLWGNQTPALISVLLSAIHYTKRPFWCLSISHPYYLVRVEHPCSQCRIWTYIFNKGLYWKTYTVFIEWCRPTVASTNSANWPIWGWENLCIVRTVYGSFFFSPRIVFPFSPGTTRIWGWGLLVLCKYRHKSFQNL